MQLPPLLQQGIEHLMGGVSSQQLIEARETLTDRYRHSKATAKRPFMTTSAQRQAYIAARMPATYGALDSTLQAIRERLPHFCPKSVWDLGAGPGTAMWALCEHFASIEQINLMEKDPFLRDIGQQLAQFSEREAMHQAQWQIGDLEHLSVLPKADLIILSYAIGELKEECIIELIQTCWTATEQLLVIVEPGTPAGFARIRSVRRQLIEIGAHMVAPCPHMLACPMTEGDWCHFSARVERSVLHRRLKGGTLGYEDEKFSYVAFAKSPCLLPESRVLSPPLKHSGHTQLKLCTPQGVQRPIISRKQGDLYKQACRVEWGSVFP